jgi:hypothetical protein
MIPSWPRSFLPCRPLPPVPRFTPYKGGVNLWNCPWGRFTGGVMCSHKPVNLTADHLKSLVLKSFPQAVELGDGSRHFRYPQAHAGRHMRLEFPPLARPWRRSQPIEEGQFYGTS